MTGDEFNRECMRRAKQINEICRVANDKKQAREMVVTLMNITNVDDFLPHMSEFRKLPEGENDVR